VLTFYFCGVVRACFRARSRGRAFCFTWLAISLLIYGALLHFTISIVVFLCPASMFIGPLVSNLQTRLTVALLRVSPGCPTRVLFWRYTFPGARVVYFFDGHSHRLSAQGGGLFVLSPMTIVSLLSKILLAWCAVLLLRPFCWVCFHCVHGTHDLRRMTCGLANAMALGSPSENASVGKHRWRFGWSFSRYGLNRSTLRRFQATFPRRERVTLKHISLLLTMRSYQIVPLSVGACPMQRPYSLF